MQASGLRGAMLAAAVTDAPATRKGDPVGGGPCRAKSKRDLHTLHSISVLRALCPRQLTTKGYEARAAELRSLTPRRQRKGRDRT